MEQNEGGEPRARTNDPRNERDLGDDVPMPSDTFVRPLERDRGDREEPEESEAGSGPFGAGAEPSLMMRIDAAPEEVVGDATEEGHAREPETGGRTDARSAVEGRAALDTDRPHATRAEHEAGNDASGSR